MKAPTVPVIINNKTNSFCSLLPDHLSRRLPALWANPVRTIPAQPQIQQQAQAYPSYNAVQLNIKNPGVNVGGATQPPMPQTATQQWQA